MLSAMVEVDRVCRNWFNEALSAGNAGDVDQKAGLYGAIWAVGSGNRRSRELSARCLRDAKADDTLAWEKFLQGAAWGVQKVAEALRADGYTDKQLDKMKLLVTPPSPL